MSTVGDISLRLRIFLRRFACFGFSQRRKDAETLRFCFFTIKGLRGIKVGLIECGVILTPSPSPKERGDGTVEISAKWVVLLFVVYLYQLFSSPAVSCRREETSP